MVLYEPTVCGYVLTFESSISCEILDFADKHGIPDDLHEISDDSEPKTEEELDDDKVVNPDSEPKDDVPFTKELRNDPDHKKRHLEKRSEDSRDTLDDDDDDDLHFEDVEDEEEDENEESRVLRKQLLDDVIRIQILR